MKTGMLVLGFLSAGIAIADGGPSVSGVGISQDSALRLITVSYSLSADAIVTAELERRDGSGWRAISCEEYAHVSGDVNARIAAGSRSFTYRPSGNTGRLEAGDFRVNVRAWTESEPPPYMVVDLVLPSAVEYYADTNAIPHGVTDNRYKLSKLVMRRIPARGVTWRMGSGSDEHLVTFEKDYWMGVYEVTQRQWLLVTGGSNMWVSTGTKYPSYRGDDRNTHPADVPRWIDIRGGSTGLGWPNGADPHAVDSASFLGKLRTRTNLAFDLPTEAQWEYAARAGQAGAFPDGSDTFKTTMGALSDNADRHSWPVGSFAPNDWGLYDVIGNVFEWVADYYQQNPYDYTVAQVEPMGPTSGYSHPTWYDSRPYRSFRGGSFTKGAASSMVSFRNGYPETYAGNDQGFRLWLAIPSAD